ncbi:MAG: hypothetical protein AB7O28_08015 [Vicinamibacterales bacterium]
MRLLIVPAILGVALIVGGPSVDLAAAPPLKNPSLKFWFGDNPGDKIVSDTPGVAYQDGVAGVVAYIDKANNGVLKIYGVRTTRSIGFTFDTCLSNCGEVPFGASMVKTPQFNAGIRNVDGTLVANGMLGMAVGTEHISGFHIWLGEHSGAQWNLCLTNKNYATGYCGIADNEDTTLTRVTRTAPGTWTFTASATVPGTDVAELFKQVQLSGKQKSITSEGTYSMPFTLTVQCVNPADCPAP